MAPNERGFPHKQPHRRARAASEPDREPAPHLDGGENGAADDRPTRRAQRYEAMLDAAERLFIARGYAATGLADIVRSSGGSLATLYELFGNKQGLLHALAVRWRDKTKAERAAKNAGPALSNREFLLSYARSEADVWRSPQAAALTRMLVSEGMRDRAFAIKTYQELHTPVVANLAQLFATWSEAGTARFDDPEAAAHLFISTISGDTLLGRILGLEDAVLDDAQIAQRLDPFFAYYGLSE